MFRRHLGVTLCACYRFSRRYEVSIEPNLESPTAMVGCIPTWNTALPRHGVEGRLSASMSRNPTRESVSHIDSRLFPQGYLAETRQVRRTMARALSARDGRPSAA